MTETNNDRCAHCNGWKDMHTLDCEVLVEVVEKRRLETMPPIPDMKMSKLTPTNEVLADFRALHELVGRLAPVGRGGCLPPLLSERNDLEHQAFYCWTAYRQFNAGIEGAATLLSKHMQKLADMCGWKEE